MENMENERNRIIQIHKDVRFSLAGVPRIRIIVFGDLYWGPLLRKQGYSGSCQF